MAMKDEAIKLFKAFVKEAHFNLCRVINLQQADDVADLKVALLHQDLWSELTAFVVYLYPQGPKADEVASILASFAQHKREDRVVLLVSDARKDKYSKAVCKALGKADVHHAVDVAPYAIKQWLRDVFQAEGYDLDAAALASIEAASEGNRTVCRHLMAHIALLFPKGRLSRRDIMPLLSDQAQFNGYQIVDAALLGQHDLLTRRLRRYPKDLTAQYPLWIALRYTLKALHDYHRLADQEGVSPIALVQRDKKRWDAQKKRFIAALTRHDAESCATLLFNALTVDFVIKGMMEGVSEQMLQQVLFQLSGVLPVTPFPRHLAVAP